MHRPDHNIQDEILKILDAQRPPTSYSESTRTMGFDDGAPEGDISYDSKPRVTLGQRFLERQSILNPNTPGFNKAVSFGIDLIPQTPEQGIAELALAPIANPVAKGVGKGLAYLGRKGAPILKKGLDQGKRLIKLMAEPPTASDIAESAFLRSNQENLVSNAFNDVPSFSEQQVREAFDQLSGENQMRFQPTQRRGPNIRDRTLGGQRPRTLAEQRVAEFEGRSAEETAILDSDRQFYEAAEREIREQSTANTMEIGLDDGADNISMSSLESQGVVNYNTEATPSHVRRMREYHRDRMASETQEVNFTSRGEPTAAETEFLAEANLSERLGSGPVEVVPEIIKVQSRTGPVIEGAINPRNIPKIQLNSITDTKRVFDHKNYRIVEKSSAPQTRNDGTKVTHHTFEMGDAYGKGISRSNDNSILNFTANTKDGVTHIKNIGFGGSSGGERKSGLLLAQILDRFPGEWVINTADNSFTWDSLALMVKSMMRRAKGVTFEKGFQHSYPSTNSNFSKKWKAAEKKLKANTSASVSPEEYAQKLRYVQQEVLDELMLDFQRSFAKNSQGKLPKGPLAPWSIKTASAGSHVQYGNITISSFYRKLAAFMGIPISQMPEFLENLDEE